MKLKRGTKYVGRVYMISTKSVFNSNMMLNYANTESGYDYMITINRAKNLVNEAYNKIINGDITFNSIKDFDKSFVKLISNNEDPDNIYILYDHPQNPKVLCKYNITEIQLYYKIISITSVDNDGLDTEDHRLQRHGLFWYLIANSADDPYIEKRFLWFTKLDKMLNWIYTKIERTAFD